MNWLAWSWNLGTQQLTVWGSNMRSWLFYLILIDFMINLAQLHLRESKYAGNTTIKHGRNVGLDCWFTADSMCIYQSQLIEDNLQSRELLCVRHRNQIYFWFRGWGKIDYDFIFRHRNNGACPRANLPTFIPYANQRKRSSLRSLFLWFAEGMKVGKFALGQAPSFRCLNIKS